MKLTKEQLQKKKDIHKKRMQFYEDKIKKIERIGFKHYD